MGAAPLSQINTAEGQEAISADTIAGEPRLRSRNEGRSGNNGESPPPSNPEAGAAEAQRNLTALLGYC